MQRHVYSPSPPFAVMITALVLIVGLLIMSGCAATPPKKVEAAKEEIEVISILKLAQCDKAMAYFAITNDGVIHAANIKELSQDQIDGIESDMQSLPEGNAGQVDLPCLPTDKT
jgi:hypothetical protein